MNSTGFINTILSRKEDKGYQANLKRGVSKGTEHYAYPLVAKFCDLAKETEAKAFITVGAFMAASKCHHTTNIGNFGASLKALALSRNGTPGSGCPTDSRASRILRCRNSKEVLEAIKASLHMISSGNVYVNYTRLIDDIINWSPEIARLWAKGYYTSNLEVANRYQTNSEEV